MYEEQPEEFQHERELEDKFREVMASSVVARRGYDVAKSFGLSEEQRLKASIIQLVEAGETTKPIRFEESKSLKAFENFVGAALCNLNEDQVRQLWYDFFVEFLGVSVNAVVEADNMMLSVMFEDPNKKCDEVINLIVHSLMPFLQEHACEFYFSYGFTAGSHTNSCLP